MKSYIYFFPLVCHICYFGTFYFISMFRIYLLRIKYLSQVLLLISTFVADRLCHVYNVINYSYFVIFFFTQIKQFIITAYICIDSNLIYDSIFASGSEIFQFIFLFFYISANIKLFTFRNLHLLRHI